jgi:hypothetical protein
LNWLHQIFNERGPLLYKTVYKLTDECWCKWEIFCASLNYVNTALLTTGSGLEIISWKDFNMKPKSLKHSMAFFGLQRNIFIKDVDFVCPLLFFNWRENVYASTHVKDFTISMFKSIFIIMLLEAKSNFSNSSLYYTFISWIYIFLKIDRRFLNIKFPTTMVWNEYIFCYVLKSDKGFDVKNHTSWIVLIMKKKTIG